MRCEMLGILEPVRYVRVADKADPRKLLELAHVERMLAEQYAPQPAETGVIEPLENPS